MRLTVACAQFSPYKAEVEANLDLIAEVARQARGEGADLLLLPETATSGYFLEGGVLESSLTEAQLVEGLARRLADLDGQLDLCLGFYEQRDGILYNSAAYVELAGGAARAVHVYQKCFLPTYGVFDEERFVTRGRDLGVFETRFGQVGVLICEDVWHSVMPMLCAVRGAQLLLIPAASPARGFGSGEIENHDRYRRLCRAIAEEHGVWVANSLLTGFEGGKGFVGGSMVVSPFGHVVGEAPVAEPHLLLAEVDLDLVGIARSQSPLIADLRSQWEEVRRMVSQSDF